MEYSECSGKALKYCYKYPRPSVTTDCVVFGFDGARLSVLLVQRGAEPFKGRWAFPGGFMEMDESAEECVRRELREETGLECGRVRQFHTFTAPGRDPRGRVITVAFYALVRPEAVCGGDDAADARWFALDAVPPLAFDHDEVLRTALAALRRDAFFEPVGADALSGSFTMGEFRALCTAIGGSFAAGSRYVEHAVRSGLLVPADGTEKPSRQEGAPRFRFDLSRYAVLAHEARTLHP